MTRILCLHGTGGSGATMWPIVGALGSAGNEVMAPTLPGHGGAPEDLQTAGWDEWLEAAAAWPADVVIGQSMGGSLALALAAAGRCRAVVALNPLAPDPDAAEGLDWQLSRGIASIDGMPTTMLLSMVNGIATIDLAAMTQPLLLVTGARDEMLDPGNADVIAAGVRGPVERLVLAASGHVITEGPDVNELLTAIRGFVSRAANPPR